jgi:hypothetical protein
VTKPEHGQLPVLTKAVSLIPVPCLPKPESDKLLSDASFLHLGVVIKMFCLGQTRSCLLLLLKLSIKQHAVGEQKSVG